MKTHPILLLLLVFGIHLHSFAGGKETQKDFGFAKHSAEISVTPNAGYYIYSKPKQGVALDEPYENNYPFLGFTFGLQYMFRPVHVFAVSAGLNFHMQGYYRHIMDYVIIGQPNLNARQLGYEGFVMLPISFHLFKQMRNSTFEFAIGPDFYFPVFFHSNTSVFNFDGEKVNTVTYMNMYNTSLTRETTSLGLSIFLGAQLYPTPKADLSIGPQISFVNLVHFDGTIQENRLNSGGTYKINLGLKLGFRLHPASKGASR